MILSIMKLYFIPPIISQFIIRIITKILFKIFCGFEIRGMENLKKVKGPVIFAGNHSSEWDGPLIRTAFPMISRFGPMFYVSREKSFYTDSGWRKYIYGGTLFKIVGAYPVMAGQKNYEASLVNYIKIIKDGGSVTIFPEGRRTKDGSFGDPKGGVAFLACATNTLVVPVGIQGIVRLNAKEFFSRKRKLILTYGKPIFPDDIVGKEERQNTEKYKEGAEKIMEEIKKLL